MGDIDKNRALVAITVNGQEFAAPRELCVIEALWQAGNARIKGVGCLNGVCGSCRVLVRRANSSEVTVELACQTHVEAEMQVIFPLFAEPSHHRYQLSDISNSDEVLSQFHHIFPEVEHCRHCGGCTESCPKGIPVEEGVRLAAEGKFREAGKLFIDCVMCDACMTSCPELIDPNHVGLFSRRVTAYFHLRPSNLINRLKQLNQGELAVDEDVDQTK